MRTYGNFNDFVDFSRSSGGTALRPISYGPELVTNGTFDTGDFTGFDNAADAWSVVDGKAVGSNTTLTNNFLIWVTGASIGKIYLGSVDVISNDVAGSSYIQWGQDSNTRVNSPAAGTYTQVFTGSAELFRANVNASGGNLVIDNISVREVLFDQAGAPLTLFNHPANIPRIEYNAAGGRLGLLVEEARTNLVTYSEDFSNAAGWSLLTGGTGLSPILTSGFSSPDGFNNAFRLQLNAGSNGASDYSLIRTTFSSGANTSRTLWIKSNTGSEQVVALVATNATTKITATTEWQRLGDGITTAGTTQFDISVGGTGATPATADVLIWGAQAEAGAFPTSYIPTSGATATRAADVCSIPVSAFGYNQAEGTVVVDVASRNSSGSHVVNINDGTTNNRIAVFGNVSMYSTSGGVNDVNSSLGTPSSQAFKAAVSVADNNYAGCLNGGSLVTDQTAVVPVSVSSVRIGADQGGTNPINGHIKSIQYIPRRLTNAQLVELTS